jgi:hypothetical protein
MFIGHFAVGFAAKRLAPRESLATLMLAALWADILFPIFVMLGIEHARIAPNITAVMPYDLYDYPWSHSLLMTLAWSLAFGGVSFAWRGDRTAAWVLAGAVFSHFILDWITHRPDMPLYPGSAIKVGLGLWSSRAGTLAVESLAFVGGVVSYATTTRSRDRKGTFGLWGFVALLALVYAGNFLGPPPSSMTGVAVGGVVANVLFAGVAWFDAHREIRG